MGRDYFRLARTFFFFLFFFLRGEILVDIPPLFREAKKVFEKSSYRSQ